MANEKRLIDANEAKCRIIAFATGCHSEVLTVDSIIMMLNQSDTVDAVEVVRCKDCGYWMKDDPSDDVGYCINPDGLDNYAKPDDFCSYGERREGE